MDMNQMLKQAQQMQKKMMEAQEELSNEIYEVNSGSNMVKIKINGKYEVLEVKIAKEVVDPEDIDLLEDLVLSATREAIKIVKDNQEGTLSKLTGGMKLPGLF